MRIGSFLLFGTFCQVAVAGGGFGAMAWDAQHPTSFAYTRAISQDEADKGSIKVCQSQMEMLFNIPKKSSSCQVFERVHSGCAIVIFKEDGGSLAPTGKIYHLQEEDTHKMGWQANFCPGYVDSQGLHHLDNPDCKPSPFCE